MAVNTAQNLIDVDLFDSSKITNMKTINRNCFERCVTTPGGKLENAEQVRVCAVMC